MPAMTSTENRLIAALRDAGHRITISRRVISKVLAESHESHMGAAEILERAGEPAESMDLSTVYRTLELFEELGVLHHVHLGHGPGIYHLTDRSDHHHLMCQDCGEVVDVPLDALAESFEGITADYGFIPDSLHFAILGRHVDCG